MDAVGLADGPAGPGQGTRVSADRSGMSNAPLRVAVLADMLEERWPSMDLVAEVLVRD